MGRFLISVLLLCCAVPSGVAADEDPAKGKFLVATDLVRGPVFQESVILLLNYDSTGAVGLIVNQPTEAAPEKALPDFEGLDGYDGKLYYGGPVDVFTLRALMRSDEPPENAIPIVDDVHIVPLAESLLDNAPDPSALRFFVGYAGWSPGQLDGELARGSWHIVQATEELVFTDEPEEIWRQLAPIPVFRASVDVADGI